jgi:hypothetical protein
MAKDDALKRLGGGRWETRDGRFQIEPQSGTWVIVDTTQTDDFGLPLVRGPYPSLTAAKEAIETTRTEGPVESPLAGRVVKPKVTSTPKTATTTKASAKVEREPEPAPPPADPKWIRDLRPIDRRKAKDLIDRLEGLGVTEAESVTRGEIAQGLPALARLAIERHIRSAVAKDGRNVDAAVKAVVAAMTAGEDADLGVSWRIVDDRGRPIDKIDPSD